MTSRVGNPARRRRHFIREWREFRSLTQRQLADLVGKILDRDDIHGGSISRIENRETGYTQDSLEAIADALGVHPGVLLMRPPSKSDSAKLRTYRETNGRSEFRSLPNSVPASHQNETRLRAREADIFAQDDLQPVIRRALAASCTIGDVPTRDRRINSLLINGYLCSVLRSTKAKRYPGSHREYIHFSLKRTVLQEVEAVIFYCAPPTLQNRIFVMPRKVLLPLFKGTTLRGSVYLPTERLPTYRNHRPRVDYWEYEDAWDRLKPKKQSAR